PEKTKAELRIDKLNPDLLKGGDVDWWLEVVAVLGNGEMPPPKKSKMSGEERTQAIELLSEEIRLASMVRRATGGHSSFRRMTRYEYNYALQDVLGLRREFARDLPPEAHSEDGFQNSSETLQMSVVQLETYRRIARQALSRATVLGPRPPMLYWGVSMKQAAQSAWSKQEEEVKNLREKFKEDPEKQAEKVDQLLASYRKPPSDTYYKNLTTGRTAPHDWHYSKARYAFKPSDSRPEVPESFDQVALMPPGEKTLIVELGEKVPDEGILRVRVLASRTSMEEDHTPSLQLEFGWQASNEGRARLRVSKTDTPITAPPEEPEFYQWDIPLGDFYPRNSVRKTSPLGALPSPSEYVRFVNSAASRGDIQIYYVEVSGPVYEQWPSESHKRLFPESEHGGDEPAYAKEILIDFMSLAWRRKVSTEDVQQKVRLFHKMRELSDTFEEAMVEVLATVLSAPEFLYIVQDSDEPTEQSVRLSERELATRLSMFLWCSVPDNKLLDLADRGRLSRPDILAEEVRRLLEDSRSKRFAKHFVRQWLDMQLLDFLQPKPGLDPLLKEAMQQEPIELFQEMLRRNENVLNFIHTDYTMANERLAKHYGLPDVFGNRFRRVNFALSQRRGGLLTQAGLLAMNSSGDDSHPLKRGIWMLESLLNDPPPPPPPAVPEIDLTDPEIAKLTLKERIEDHRNHPACMSCHVKIDPWGVAFENFDALGRWRNTIKGKPVDATSRLFNDELLNGMDGLKRFLLKNRQDQFVQAMVHKMTVYSLGRPLTFADRAGVEEIIAQVRQQGDGLATLITEVVTSELFRRK
ncbi:MAG: DUF1592 domain-containing protein, partial [Planctomycetes bacterium]|nr:DUF1592 domain-containing protein [Planctomycetota bacterium]